MPAYTLTLTDADAALLARVQRRFGFPSADVAAEWLLKKRLHRAARQTTGRGRSLYMLPRDARRAAPQEVPPCA